MVNYKAEFVWLTVKEKQSKPSILYIYLTGSGEMITTESTDFNWRNMFFKVMFPVSQNNHHLRHTKSMLVHLVANGLLRVIQDCGEAGTWPQTLSRRLRFLSRTSLLFVLGGPINHDSAVVCAQPLWHQESPG